MSDDLASTNNRQNPFRGLFGRLSDYRSRVGRPFTATRSALRARAGSARRVGRKHAMDLALGLVAGISAMAILIPPATGAAYEGATDDGLVSLVISAMQRQAAPSGALPTAEETEPIRTMRIPITAYTSEVAQTDSTPFITASGTHVRDGVVAANFLPIGSYVKIPELYGDKVFVVEDRMNPRYYYKMDIWMDDKREAIQFGVKYATVEVYPGSREKVRERARANYQIR